MLWGTERKKVWGELEETANAWAQPLPLADRPAVLWEAGMGNRESLAPRESTGLGQVQVRHMKLGVLFQPANPGHLGVSKMANSTPDQLLGSWVSNSMEIKTVPGTQWASTLSTEVH